MQINTVQPSTFFGVISYLSQIPKNDSMADDLEQRKMKAISNRRSIMDFGMGIIYLAMGVFFSFADKFGIALSFPTKPFNYIFGGLCVLYGGFRIYRGYKKNYFR